MKKNYYDELIENIEQLISNNKKDEALKIIKDELSLIYVPIEYEKKLNSYLHQIEPENEESKRQKLFSRDELITIISEYEKHSSEFLIEIASLFDENNWRGYENQINKIFNLKNLDKKVKSIIYNSLVVQDIDYDFEIENVKINPKKNKTTFETEFSLKNLMKLSKKDYEISNVRDVSERIFFIYIMNQFPKCLSFDYEDITEEISNIAYVMLGIKSENDLNEKEKEIFSIIKYK